MALFIVLILAHIQVALCLDITQPKLEYNKLAGVGPGQAGPYNVKKPKYGPLDAQCCPRLLQK